MRIPYSASSIVCSGVLLLCPVVQAQENIYRRPLENPASSSPQSKAVGVQPATAGMGQTSKGSGCYLTLNGEVLSFTKTGLTLAGDPDLYQSDQRVYYFSVISDTHTNGEIAEHSSVTVCYELVATRIEPQKKLSIQAPRANDAGYERRPRALPPGPGGAQLSGPSSNEISQPETHEIIGRVVKLEKGTLVLECAGGCGPIELALSSRTKISSGVTPDNNVRVRYYKEPNVAVSVQRLPD